MPESHQYVAYCPVDAPRAGSTDFARENVAVEQIISPGIENREVSRAQKRLSLTVVRRITQGGPYQR